MNLEFEGVVPSVTGLAVEVDDDNRGAIRWSITNDSTAPVPVDRVHVRFRIDAGATMFRNGYQSWSAAGRDPRADPSTLGAPGLLRAMHHADPAVVAAGETRSELVTALSDDGSAVVLGFDGGDRHDGTFRRQGETLVAEAYLGGAVLQPGERRELHAVLITDSLDSWARQAGAAAGARVDAPYQVGWCSWYQYFHDITEPLLRDNLARAQDWPFDVFQLDDGYQAAIGDWLLRAPTFPTPLDALAADISAAGFQPGLWLAPFLAAPTSALAHQHPEWLLMRPSGRPAVGNVNPGWGGEVHVLDTTRPDVLAHLENLAGQLVAMGWTYLKLDFTYAPAFDGLWHDASLTPAQRVRQAYDAVRRGAGDNAFLLGCGAPLGPCIGVVDGMRIGPDVAPHWEPGPSFPGYEPTAPSTANALRNTIARAFMHRRLWLNDPDCLMLRTAGTDLTEDQVRAWAMAVADSGGMALVSDDLSLLDAEARALLDEVLVIGRAADDEYR
jgi:alpha-galactosidase